jgi:glycosyltransferase involved in cell wall biosynthesis
VLLSLSIDEVKPLTILEAISLGIPVVATNIPAHMELAVEFKAVTCVPTPIAFIFEHASEISQALMAVNNGDRLSLERYQWSAFKERTNILIAALAC